MKKISGSFVLVMLVFFVTLAQAADKVVVIPLGGCNNSNSIIGSWVIYDEDSGDPSVLTFLSDSFYMVAESGTSDLYGEPGMELGTYTWNTATGDFTATVTQETNGGWGLAESGSPTAMNVTVDHNTITLTFAPDESYTLPRVTP